MLRITVHDNPQVLTFQVEGRLTGPWLRELEECWKSTLAHPRKSILRVDLTGVTFIDDAAKTCLAAMHRQGAEFVAVDCLTKDIVAEIRDNCKIENRALVVPPLGGILPEIPPKGGTTSALCSSPGRPP